MNGLPGRRRDPLGQPHRRLGGDGGVRRRHRHLVRAAAGHRAAQAGRGRHPARLRPPRAGAGVDGPGRDLRVLPGVEARTRRWSCARCSTGWWAYKLRSVPGRHRGQRHGRRGQAVPGGPRSQAAGRLPADAERRRSDVARAQQRRVGGGYIEKNRESFVIRGDAQFKQRRGHREHRASPPTPTARRCCCKNVAQGAASARRCASASVTKHGEGEIVAGTVMMLIGANSREVVHAVKAQAGRDPEASCPRASRSARYYDRAEFIDRMLKTVGHQPGRGRAAGRRGPVPHARAACAASLIAALAIPLAMGVARHRHGAAGRHRQPDVAGRDRLRPARRRRDRHARGGAGRSSRVRPAADARGHRRAVSHGDAQGGARRSTFALPSSCWSTCR